MSNRSVLCFPWLRVSYPHSTLTLSIFRVPHSSDCCKTTQFDFFTSCFSAASTCPVPVRFRQNLKPNPSGINSNGLTVTSKNGPPVTWYACPHWLPAILDNLIVPQFAWSLNSHTHLWIAPECKLSRHDDFVPSSHRSLQFTCIDIAPGISFSKSSDNLFMYVCLSMRHPPSATALCHRPLFRCEAVQHDLQINIFVCAFPPRAVRFT